ncbi:MAG: hypothetical protein K2J32_09470 [Ruminococcus sp.]|nr:hypothetical protein [Ruminococcus sp.]
MKEAETREEVFALPYYFTENGKKRYMEVHDYRQYRYKVFDEYGRMIKDYYYGDWWEKRFNDFQHTVICIDCNGINGQITRIKRDMYEWEYIENYWKDDR